MNDDLSILDGMPGREIQAESPTVVGLRQSLGLDRCQLSPYAHQVIGIQALINNAYFALLDEMGAGKTIQIIIAAQILYLRSIINRVIVIAPASVRPVWFDPELGELSKHLWPSIHNRVSEFHAKIRQWELGTPTMHAPLKWIVTNYEFIGRSKQRLAQLMGYCGNGTLLVLDESSAVAARGTLQTKACTLLRWRCGRVVLLNGTFIGESPMDLMSQGNIMHPSILQCKYVTQFRERYAVMKQNEKFPQIVGWKNLDDLQRRFAPYVLRRLKKDCIDLPEKLPPVTMTVTLTPATWIPYKSMRDEMVAWLTEGTGSIAGQAVTRALRLAQITSGFLGGIEEILNDEEDSEEQVPVSTSKEIGREKLDFCLSFHAERLAADPNLKLLIWCRFRAEATRLHRALCTRHPNIAGELGLLMGGQKKGDRQSALRLLHPQTAPSGPAGLIGTYGTGSMGHNFTAAHTVLNCSFDYSLRKFLQSMDRVHRPGQVHAVSYYDVVAVGPQGQKTIDHAIVKARRKKEDIATWTSQAWIRALMEE